MSRCSAWVLVCRSVPVGSVCRAGWSGSPVRPRSSVVACWIRWRHWSALPAARAGKWTGVRCRPGLWELLVGSALRPGGAVCRRYLDRFRPGLALSGEPGPEDLPGSGPGPCAADGPDRWHRVPGGGVDDHDDRGGVPVAPPGVAPHVLVDAEDLHVIEAVGVIWQRGLCACQDPGSWCRRCAGRCPGSARPGRPARAPGRGLAAPVPPLSGLQAPAAGPGPRCPAWATGGGEDRPGAARTTGCAGLHPAGTWAGRRAGVPRDSP